ncbi:MAG: 2-oxoglutarate dehydrogenase E1 component [Gammaproteobacteria bacterium AqS3]|nr:2-oxoglutarate dehydrogenase E1 component [Gammaproteobacteria bacterium AqS3]
MSDKTSQSLEQHRAQSHIQGGSAAWLEAVYAQYLEDPESVDPQWRAHFDALPRANGAVERSHEGILERLRQQGRSDRRAGAAAAVASDDESLRFRLNALAVSYRRHGHLAARTNPLNWTHSPPDWVDSALSLERHEITPQELKRAPSLRGQGSMADDVERLKSWYCGSIGWEYSHINEREQRLWFRERIESEHASPDAAVRQRTLDRLIAADGLERYLAVRYSGAKRFGLEGGESLIPLADALLHHSGAHGCREMVLGMAHRGRLNVLVNLMGKQVRELCDEFEGAGPISDEMSGDVKYHMGFSSSVQTGGGTIQLALAFNPSHLAIVGSVVMGSVRARQDHRSYSEARQAVMPVLIHGDAAFSGQGVIMESLQMSRTRGYGVGGTIHVLVNNQIGFTTSHPNDARSTYYASDVAKMIGAPVIHVNGEQPDAVVRAAKIAVEYRQKFGSDVVIDMICYRKGGHNEVDEPALTQPMMYREIGEKSPVVELYAEQLVKSGEIAEGELQERQSQFRRDLEAGGCVAPDIIPANHRQFEWADHLDAPMDERIDTSFDRERLVQLAQTCNTPKPDMKLHRQTEALLSDRLKMAAGELPANWGFAEVMAYATILDQGYSLRITGQDVRRGTFAHRQVVVRDQEADDADIPLRHCASYENQFEIYDSLLSEEAVLAFEYGYSATVPKSLVIWEAQFGDFANGAQVVIDQFITSGRNKWGRHSGLVLLLPHGYEGQGPEHSSARLERYLQLCAEYNIEVCVPSTSAQIFHLMRRQILRKRRTPLVVLSPKSLLRAQHSSSDLEQLYNGSFQNVLIDGVEDPERIERLVLCTGKVYYDLEAERRKRGLDNVNLIRVERLYPFPFRPLMRHLGTMPNVNDVVWCQEEPRNQGVWQNIGFRIHKALEKHLKLRYSGRLDSASTAVGYAAQHAKEQHALVLDALLGTKAAAAELRREQEEAA